MQRGSDRPRDGDPSSSVVETVRALAERGLAEDEPERWRIALEAIVSHIDRSLSPDAAAEPPEAPADGGPAIDEPSEAAERFDVARMVESMAESFDFRIGQRPVELISLVAADMPRAVVGRADAVRRILSELLDNALRLTEAGAVSVECSWSKGLRLAVSDTGPGMPALPRARYFGRQHGPDPRRADAGGEATGLALCQRLVGELGGRMHCTSRSGQGTEIEVSLPFEPADTRARPLPHRIEGRVLLIEDEPRLRASLARALEDLGFLVDDAGDGREAVRAVRRATTAYDLALLDAELPDAPGSALLDLIGDRAPLRDVPRVAMTRNEAYLGPRVRKPVTRWRLERAVERALGRTLSRRRSPEATSPPEHRRVLVVDDSVDSRRLAARVLGEHGYRVDQAFDGVEAVRLAGEHVYDLILMDVEMPRMGGLDAARAIRAAEPEGQRVPIVAVTAHDDHAFRARCIEAGMDDHVPRPVRQARLLQVTERALGVVADPSAGDEPPTDPLADPLADALPAITLAEDVLDLLPEFVDNRRADVAALRRWSRGDGGDEDARRVAHGLKGVGGAFGFPAISALGAALGTAVRAGDRARAEACIERLDTHIQAIGRVVAEAVR